MNVVIVEDERLAAERLADILQAVDQQIKVLKVLESVEEAVNWFSSHSSPDLVFMDIQLEDGISFEIFDEVKIEAPVIFTTAFDEYAIRAFKVNSVDYLLKPINREELAGALLKFKKKYNEQLDFELKVRRVIENVSNRYKSRFFIKIGMRFQSVPVSRICCFFVEERNTFLKTAEGKIYDLDQSLDQLQSLVDPEQFFRVNRNFLVNINCIVEVVSYSTNRLKLKLEKDFEEGIIVSRDKVTDFKRWMDK
ncbi:LytTR family DNA-binding domain-containing protein [Maribellus sp. YY47]|uniref:LytR/AlgR family response regulator transcription factor n=1 Tax=Maribellus sp. YY47 TaxID=2929486 RepID=UPI002000A7A1|nr:LytTR family DNA-binding domain-containing protein [Maribellus sp. YY47]MCK3683995.1 LytTR family DNA-binding domain-containing protein [Maribellus sp. YY47]